MRRIMKTALAMTIVAAMLTTMTLVALAQNPSIRVGGRIEAGAAQ